MGPNQHIDHIDPSWKEGRDYQLVCGLDVAYNMEERDPILNMSKNNRFLPWRWSKDEIGEVPRNQGDLCLFLDPDTDEWVLEEFLGSWWYEKSKRYLGSTNYERPVWTPEQIAVMTAHNWGRKKSPEELAKIVAAHKGAKRSPETRERIRQAALRRDPATHYRGEMTEERKQKIREGVLRANAQKRLRQMAVNDPLLPDFED